MSGTGGFTRPQHHVEAPQCHSRSDGISLPARNNSLTQRKHEAYCKASRIACELMPELLVFHTEIRETRSILPPADLEFRSAPLHACGQDGRRALSTCSDSRKCSRRSSSLHDPPRFQGKHTPQSAGVGNGLNVFTLNRL